MCSAKTIKEGFNFLKDLPELIGELGKLWEAGQEGTMLLSGLNTLKTASTVISALGTVLDLVRSLAD